MSDLIKELEKEVIEDTEKKRMELLQSCIVKKFIMLGNHEDEIHRLDNEISYISDAKINEIHYEYKISQERKRLRMED